MAEEMRCHFHAYLHRSGLVVLRQGPRRRHLPLRPLLLPRHVLVLAALVLHCMRHAALCLHSDCFALGLTHLMVGEEHETAVDNVVDCPWQDGPIEKHKQYLSG